MAVNDRAPARIASSIDLLRRQFGLGATSTVNAIETNLGQILGADLAARTGFVELRRGILVLDAQDSATAEAVGWSRLRLIDELRRLCPGEEISDVAVRVRRPRRQ